jgi:hypothetical protein
MPWTNVQLLASVRDRTGTSTYNNATYNSFNQNLVQGQIHSVSVNEVNFPYDIPNVQVRTTDFFELFTDVIAPPGISLQITIAPGFYTGTELANAITAAIIAAGAAGVPVVLPANLPVCNYSAINNRFTFTLAAPTIAGLDWGFSSPYTYPNSLTVVQPNVLGKDIMSIMGFLPSQNGGNPIVDVNTPFVGAASAPLSFTQYIDICSPELCQYQYFRDGSTTNLARRSDVICRLYISNNVATQEDEGTRPFVINRQYNNARVMRWSTGSSVGSMSIQLFDDVGQPLQTTWQPRPYQITFNVYEQDKDGTTY